MKVFWIDILTGCVMVSGLIVWLVAASMLLEVMR